MKSKQALSSSHGKRKPDGEKTNPTLKQALESHGSLQQWRSYETLQARLRCGGAVWQMKGQINTMDDLSVEIDLHSQRVSHFPFLKKNQRTVFDPSRIAIETFDGKIIKERMNPRDSFVGHSVASTWDELQLAYFAAYTARLSLTTPFMFADEDFRVTDLDSIVEDGKTFKKMKVLFPERIAAHSSVEIVYFSEETNLLFRRDYQVDIAGRTLATHYLNDYQLVNGIMVPTQQSVHVRSPNGEVLPKPIIVTMAVSEVQFRSKGSTE